MAIRVPWIYHTYYGGDLGARVEAERVGQRRARQQRLCRGAGVVSTYYYYCLLQRHLVAEQAW